jgi:hypothetical protein
MAWHPRGSSVEAPIKKKSSRHHVQREQEFLSSFHDNNLNLEINKKTAKGE